MIRAMTMSSAAEAMGTAVLKEARSCRSRFAREMSSVKGERLFCLGNCKEA